MVMSMHYSCFCSVVEDKGFSADLDVALNCLDSVPIMEASEEELDQTGLEEEEEEVEFIEIEKNPIASDLMLPYETSIFTELHESDSSGGALLITSNGLGLHRIFLSILKVSNGGC